MICSSGGTLFVLKHLKSSNNFNAHRIISFNSGFTKSKKLLLFFCLTFYSTNSLAACDTLNIYQNDGVHTLENMPADAPHASLYFQSKPGSYQSKNDRNWGFNQIVSLHGEELTPCGSQCLDPAMFSLEYRIRDEKFIAKNNYKSSLLEYLLQKQIESIESQKYLDKSYDSQTFDNGKNTIIRYTEISGFSYEYYIYRDDKKSQNEDINYFYICESGSLIQNKNCTLTFRADSALPVIGQLIAFNPKLLNKVTALSSMSSIYAKDLLNKSKCEAGAKP